MDVPHGHSLAAEAAWHHEQQATGKPAAFSLTSKSERRSLLNSTLIIAEKPSVALAIAAVVGAANRKNGYLEGNGYLVSWCVGHLVSLRSLKTMTFGWRVGGAQICRFCPTRGSTSPMKRRKSSLSC